MEEPSATHRATLRRRLADQALPFTVNSAVYLCATCVSQKSVPYTTSATAYSRPTIEHERPFPQLVASMVQSASTDRAVQLVREAVELVDAGHREAASRNIREAISLAPANEEVRSVFKKISEDEETGHPLVNLCRRYVTYKDEGAGREAASRLRADDLVPPPEAAIDALNLILSCPAASLSNTQDEIITALMRSSPHIRRHFAAQLQLSVTQFFDEIYDRGDGAVTCLDTAVLDTALWRSEQVRNHCKSELFQLFIAKLMESGHDLDGRSLKGIARLLAVDAENLQHLVDEECFDAILSSLDLRLPSDVRSQATLATAKYLEAAGETGQTLFSKILTARVSRQRNDDYVIAFSAAAAVFPIIPSITATLFLTNKFVQSLAGLLEQKRRGRTVERAVLELFNAACIDKECREAIDSHCGEWLSRTLSRETDEHAELAAVILAKIRASENGAILKSTSASKVLGNELSGGSSHDLVERFKNLLAQRPQKGDFHRLVEGLVFSSVKPDVKEQLVSKGSSFQSDLEALLKNNITDQSLIYGGLMIIHNLTKYRPTLSEEQKKISELRSYANASTKPAASDPLDDDNYVKERCAAVINAGIMPLLIDCNKSNATSNSIQDLISKILLSLSKTPQTRGKLAQQGAVKLLLSLLSSRTENSTNYRQNDEPTQNAAHALARILISVNPGHVFSSTGSPQITTAIRPLVYLLDPSSLPSTTTTPPSPSLSTETPRDLLPAFESLLALTNLASTSASTSSSPPGSISAPSAAALITRLAFPTIENLLLSSNIHLQRAATELTCNLTTCPDAVAKFADGTHRAAQRLHILLALADARDLATRRAAGGALAALTEFEGAVEAVLEREGGVEVVLAMCREGESGGGGMEMVHRGLVCVRNMGCCEGEVGRKARRVLKERGAVEVLRGCLVGGAGATGAGEDAAAVVAVAAGGGGGSGAGGGGGGGMGEEVLRCGVEGLRILVEG
ncbi:conserved hypothetical protein [Histoplasma capsulatum G186AR]|uniref:UNC-45/Cro1/She4 central domain-containing protein n=1 Tax=Ajellomyces capsulatus (strain G186AR / H82 / ATCC MYA-2454 / RMSCC 2432) TaxID=447093 RepID=C0NNU1_AJECG|nr:uncharacterized protein HCBG_04821 [Histoplasma capsulatum G186AR]EEH06601.1 conserved hypothetical protein [Histoplasma capsulatum G186AR]